MKLLKWLAPLLLCLCLISCTDDEETMQIGMKPIYLSGDPLKEISSSGPVAVRNTGKIYVKGDILFMNESGAGVHVFNNSDPSNPEAVAFISIHANYDIAVKGNVMYADNGPDLLALDISDPSDVQVLKRVSNAYDANILSFPQGYTGYFECVDDSKGTVVGWEEKELINPKCRR